MGGDARRQEFRFGRNAELQEVRFRCPEGLVMSLPRLLWVARWIAWRMEIDLG